MTVSAAYYDGRTTQRHAVELYADGARLVVRGAGIDRAARLAELDVSERLGAAPRLLRFGDGAFCEVRDHAGLHVLLERLGHREGAIARWQRSAPLAAVSALLVAALLAGGYVWGLPWAAARAAQHVPADVDRLLSQQTLSALEDGMLSDSRLPAARQEQLREGFARLRVPEATRARIDVRFRAGAVGPNAFALPDGTVVLLDELVALAGDDREIYAVLAHEVGHVHHRHGVRLLLQGSVVGLLAAWWLGDLSGLLAGAPAALLQARYSRGFEAEADRYAATLLRANGIAPAQLAAMLEKLAGAHGGRAGAGWVDYLASHPAPHERIEALKGE